MIICPECRQGEIVLSDLIINPPQPDPEKPGARLPVPDAPKCSNCNWKGELQNGVVKMMQSKVPVTRRGYQEFYEGLAAEDLASAIMEEDYHQALNRHTAESLGDMRDKIGCELGAGKGSLIRELLGRGAKVTAVDIANNYLQALVGYSNLLRVQADAENLPFENEFDFLTCTDVLEHVLNPGNLMYCINRALKPGGMVAIRVPADENLLVYSAHLGCTYDLVHLRTFNKEGLNRMMRGSGFANSRIIESGQSLSMLLPDDYEEQGLTANEIDQTRAILQSKGISPSDFFSFPEWFRKKLSKTYFYLVLAEKTHEIEADASQGFVLKPVA